MKTNLGVQRSNSANMCIIFTLCILWYIVSSSNNVIGKWVLNEFPYPITVTMVQLCSITLYSGPFFKMWGIRKYKDMSRAYYLRIIVPLAFGKFLSSVASHVSLWKVPVSYAHTVKATMPLFTVGLSRLLFGERQPNLVYLSLLPIITGVAIATMTEISFDMVGLISALISTMGFSLQNIFSKKVLKDTGIHHLRLLHLLGKMALFMFLPFWIYMDGFQIISHPAMKHFDYRVIALLFTDGVLNWLQNIIAFSVLSLVVPLTYAVASASKRIFVIAVSLFVLGNPVTWLNCCGMALAIFGVLCYNQAKHITREKFILPITQNNGVKYTSLKSNSINQVVHYYNAIEMPIYNNNINNDNNNIIYNDNIHDNRSIKTNGYTNHVPVIRADTRNDYLLFYDGNSIGIPNRDENLLVNM